VFWDEKVRWESLPRDVEATVAVVLKTLSERHRAVLTLKFKEGYSKAEVAKVLGISYASVQVGQSSALKRISSNSLLLEILRFGLSKTQARYGEKKLEAMLTSSLKGAGWPETLYHELLSTKDAIVPLDAEDTLEFVLSTLEEKDREIIFLRYKEECVIKTIADQMGLTPSAVDCAIYRAIKALRSPVHLEVIKSGIGEAQKKYGSNLINLLCGELGKSIIDGAVAKKDIKWPEGLYEAVFQHKDFSLTFMPTDHSETVSFALDTLSMHEKTVLLLAYREGKTLSEISKEMGMPQSKIVHHLHKALDIMRTPIFKNVLMIGVAECQRRMDSRYSTASGKAV
jgi:DNA-directed RNA polymerase specialized sigma24 family protein